MDGKYNQQNNQKHAAGGCSSTCHKCKGNCMQQAQHNGPHKCNNEHSW